MRVTWLNIPPRRLRKCWVAAYKYQDLTWKQYRGGTINYIDVLDAQRRYLDARIAKTNAIRDEHLALVQLYKALGGGWKLK